MAVPPRLTSLSPVATKLVMAIRFLALCARSRQDPVAHLTSRLGSVTAAKALLDLADCAAHSWPETVQVCKPCCCALSPDESVFAGMAEAARRGDREGFGEVLSGFIRTDRHERLYAHAVEAVAHIG
ncbi:MAG: DNA-directed RNA polymerase subunit beta' [Erythrobacter sp.]|nr:MAG: DNA-directed RNA polymerase subunit beta' [Erythrobacter sp.]